MFPGAIEIQIIVSVVVVLVAAFAALICDYLKGNNDWLRLRNTELSVRVEERERFFSPELWVSKIRELLLSPEVRSALVADLKPEIGVPAPANYRTERPSHPDPAPAADTPPSAEVWASKEELVRLAERAAKIRERHEAAHREEPQRLEEEVETVPTRGALYEDSPREAFEAPPEPQAEYTMADSFDNAETIEPDSDLDELFDRTFGQVQWPTGETPRLAPDASSGQKLPAGLVDSAAIDELLAAEATITGVVAAVSINDYEDLRTKATPAELTAVEQGVESLISGMLSSDRSFGTRIVDDQFLLFFAGEVGASGQRILFQLSERLWDFQLRSLGRTPVVFSWGGLEVSDQSIATAIEAAQERMMESRRSRKVRPIAVSSRR
jgi:hypothetical protein